MGWLTALTTLMPLSTEWLKQRGEIKEAKHKAEMERIKSSATEREGSWKDEVILIVVAYPLVSVFIPGLRSHTIDSLDYLAELPDWVVWTWVAIVTAVYGVAEIPKKLKR